MSDERRFDVVVVGAGNAALCAALAAHEEGASVAVLEWAPEGERGGNSAFTGGTMRVAYHDVEELRRITDLSDETLAKTEFGSYPPEDFYIDVATVTNYRSDPDLLAMLTDRSQETLVWMRKHGVSFVPAFGKYSFQVEKKRKFWGGVAVETAGGGVGLIDALMSSAERAGITTAYGHRAVSLITDDGGRVSGVSTKHDGVTTRWQAGAVVLASGGFEANPEWRARYLGSSWDLAKVRGSRFNMGDGIRMALDAGAMPFGNWSGCHAVGWDLNAPAYGDRKIMHGFGRHSYILGILVNAEGRRFVDEGADFRNRTYAKYGREILNQPGQFAWQIFDSKVIALLRPDLYQNQKRISKVTADTLDDLVAKLEGVNAEQCLETIKEFNSSIMDDIPFHPEVKDGRRTRGITPPKSNWANALDEPPFEAYPITCGITFTFGGVQANTAGQVLDMSGDPISGLFAAGEMAAGIFYGNYLGSTGLTWGAVSGRQAGSAAAAAARQSDGVLP